MTASNFERALSLVLGHEGGFVNHPADPGGATNKGITQRTYDAWRRSRGEVTRDVRKVTAAEVSAIYRRQYWDVVRGNDLPAGVDYAVFDYAVNSGPSRSIKDLQRVVGSRADGAMGANTLAAVMEEDSMTIIEALCTRRMAFLKSLKHWSTFGKGWTRRVNAVRDGALDMAESRQPVKLLKDTGGSTKADPADVAMSKTPEAAAGALTGTGAAGAAVSEVAQQLTPLTDFSDVIKWAFVGLMLIGVTLTVATLLWRFKERAE